MTALPTRAEDNGPSGAPSARTDPTVRDGRSTLRVIVGGTAWNTLAQFVPVPINIVMTPYLIHHLGVDRWGLIAVVTTLESILTSFDGGLTGSLKRYFAIYAGTDDRASTTRMLTSVLAFILGAGAVLGLVGWLIAPALVGLFSMPGRLRPETTFFLRVVVSVFAVTFLRNAISAVVIARQRYALISVLNVSTYGVWIVGLILTVRGGWGLRGVAVTFLAQHLLATLVIVPSALRYLDRRSVGFLPGSELRSLFSYSAKVQVSGLSRLANAEFDNVVIGTVLSVHSVALYNAGSGLATQVTGVLGNALTPAATFLARTFGARGEKGSWETFLRLQRVWAIVCNGCYAAALGASYYAIVDWLGPGFGTGGVIAMIIVAGQAVLSMAMMLGFYCIILGRAGIEVRVGVINVVVNVALTVALVTVGVLGVVVATVAAWVASSWWLLREARRSVSPETPNFIDVLSLPASIVTALSVFAMEYALHPVIPEGPVGLVAAAGPAVVGLGIFGVIRFGPGPLVDIVREALGVRSDGVRAMGGHLAAAMVDAAGGRRPGAGR